MRGIGTWLVAGAVCVLALAALVDAVLGGGETRKATPKPRPTVTTDDTAAIRATLQRIDARGTITYSDTKCGLHTVTLPTLAEGAVGAAPSCDFAVSPGNVWSADGRVPDPRTGAVALCLRSGAVEVRAADGSTLGAGRGCGPAWTPDGTLTVVRSGELYRLEPRLGGGVLDARAVLTRPALEAELQGTQWGRSAPFVREAAWLADDLVAVIVGSRRGADGLALFRQGRLVDLPLGPYRTLARLRPSPRGSYASAVLADGSGVVVMDARGQLVGIPIRSGQAIAWSPDETFALVASPGGTALFDLPPVNDIVGLHIVARDLVWD